MGSSVSFGFGVDYMKHVFIKLVRRLADTLANVVLVTRAHFELDDRRLSPSFLLDEGEFREPNFSAKSFVN